MGVPKWALHLFLSILISFQIILTLGGHWSGGTEVLIVNCLRMSYNLIGSLPVLCHAIQSQFLGAMEGGGVGASEEHLQTSAKASTLFFRRLRDRYPAQPVDISIRNYLHFIALLGFFWDSDFFGIPRSARTYGLGPARSGMHILQPELPVRNDTSFLTYAFSQANTRLIEQNIHS